MTLGHWEKKLGARCGRVDADSTSRQPMRDGYSEVHKGRSADWKDQSEHRVEFVGRVTLGDRPPSILTDKPGHSCHRIPKPRDSPSRSLRLTPFFRLTHFPPFFNCTYSTVHLRQLRQKIKATFKVFAPRPALLQRVAVALLSRA